MTDTKVLWPETAHYLMIYPNNKCLRNKNAPLEQNLKGLRLGKEALNWMSLIGTMKVDFWRSVNILIGIIEMKTSSMTSTFDQVTWKSKGIVHLIYEAFYKLNSLFSIGVIRYWVITYMIQNF